MMNSIYNTVNDVPVIQGVENILEIVLGKPELKWAALIDTAFNYEKRETLIDLVAAINCYDFPELQGLKVVAPCLVPLLTGNELRMQITQLIRHCQGRPMLSFVGTSASLKEISKRWRAIHMISVVDEQPMLLRFADTRSLSYFPKVLTGPQLAAICGSVCRWVYFDRYGCLTSVDIPKLSNCPNIISITKEQLSGFLDASRPDALMASIAESMYDIVPASIPVAERYFMIKNAYEIAKRNKIDDNADILALAVAAYISEGRSNVDQRLESLLSQRTWPAGSLGDAIVDEGII